MTHSKFLSEMERTGKVTRRNSTGQAPGGSQRGSWGGSRVSRGQGRAGHSLTFQVELEGCYRCPLLRGYSREKTWFVLLLFPVFKIIITMLMDIIFEQLLWGLVYLVMPSVA
ncbi:unnamed protein product [Cuscuta europaea]|uniref:Uncharacterized protein n=1 Tax=Cuscuta europaea TaxID=41803 RepID=A0A9P0ZR82_CUSEU|nr:unnamed protein product [Cuscuta europaea]